MSKLVLSTLFIALLSSTSIAAPDAGKIVEQADDARMPNQDVSFQVTIKDLRGAKKLNETTYQVLTLKGGDSSLVETVAPARQKGRKLLMKGNDLWFFTPDIKRPTRVSMQQRLTGEVANGDISRTNFAGDYEAKLEGEETVKGQDCYKLSLKAKNSSVTYSKVNYWVAKKNNVPVQAEFFAVSGKLLKRARYEVPKVIMGLSRITQITIEDAIDANRKSVMVYAKHKAQKIDPGVFNKDAMVD